MDFSIFQRKTPLQKEWEALLKKEQRFLEGQREKKESALNRLLAEKVPAKLQDTLDAAIEKAFYIVFEKGTSVIKKTYRKDDLEKDFAADQYARELKGSRKTLRTFSKKAAWAGRGNLALSGVSGVGLGLLGVGLPDIPLLTGMLLKCVYEIALRYGYSYTAPEERYFVLLLIEGAVSYGEGLSEVEHKIELFLENGCAPLEAGEQIKRTGKALAKELLYMKFLQGIPLVGAVGGAYDAICMKKVSAYAALKYQKRFLLDCKQRENQI